MSKKNSKHIELSSDEEVKEFIDNREEEKEPIMNKGYTIREIRSSNRKVSNPSPDPITRFHLGRTDIDEFILFDKRISK